MKPKCPKCGSADITIYDEDVSFLTCNKCGYDESEEEAYPEQRTSQKEKARYTPYKTGGKGRTRKK